MYIDSDKSIQCETCGNWRKEFWLDNGKSWCVSCLASDRLTQLARIERMESELRSHKAAIEGMQAQITNYETDNPPPGTEKK